MKTVLYKSCMIIKMELCRLFLSILLALSLVLPSAHSSEWYEADNPHFLNTQTIFPAIQTTNSIKVIKFFSPWCKYCRFIKAYVQNWKNTHEISSNMLFYDFNCQQNGAMFCAEHFQVRAYPSVIFINEKGETMSRIDGVYPEDVVFSILDQYHEMAKTLKDKEVKDEQKQHQNTQVSDNQKTQQEKTETIKQVKQTEGEVKQKDQQEVKEESKGENQNLEKEKEVEEKKEPIPQKPEVKQKEAAIVPQKAPQKQSQPTPKPEQVPAKSSINTQKSSPQKLSSQIFSQPTPTLNPSDISSESKNPQQQPLRGESSSPSILKYLLYFCGAGVGLIYAYRIYVSKSDHHDHDHESVNSGQQQPRSIPAAHAVVTHRDIEKEILVEEIMDENL